MLKISKHLASKLHSFVTYNLKRLLRFIFILNCVELIKILLFHYKIKIRKSLQTHIQDFSRLTKILLFRHLYYIKYTIENISYKKKDEILLLSNQPLACPI